MKKPNRPGWYWTTDTGTGESVKMWWNGSHYMDESEINELMADSEQDNEEDELT